MIKDADEFVESIKLLGKLEKKLVDYIDCDDFHEISFFQKFDATFNKMNIKENYDLYEVFIRLLCRISLSRPSLKTSHKKIVHVISTLISDYEMLEVFHVAEIFNTFKNNRSILLHLFKQNIITARMLCQEVYNTHNTYFFLFFYPEIQHVDPKLFTKMTKKFNNVALTIKKYDDSLDLFFKKRDVGHSEDEVAEIIRNDDIDQFTNLLERSLVGINSKIFPSIFESNSDINSYFNGGASLLEYSMIFGSINIFKYLLLHQAVFNQKSYRYAIIGGSNEIIHILEDDNRFKFDKECLIKSIGCHYFDITYYLKSSLSLSLSKDEEFINDIESLNFYQFSEFIKTSDELVKIVDLFPDSFVNYLIYITELFFLKFLLRQDHMDINTNIIYFIYLQLSTWFLTWSNMPHL
ncbi:hypothetical protein TRFO_05866 [Tritrichomonas foetus]|uniref:Uncharacterized protein n=1 Tax=Tritrichomonas foetus TaxID=1144522 RepID=A0A1J4K7P6_9EUKA|nr:hypothetical protein TRFO_05866 [Tritrichomonas foetus]|eukprot:OHT05710.1 hypothetical protein TRFO_05866 [Tritrichomonas foetus]